ncbi:peptidase domain-containing ABC transporter [Prevotella sp. P2-180]|uniref:peptidase domain-containing ABC transporter n=1 Tax=Prevotella sp. P2-180 TaxID=2024224 RepID=UPI000B95D69E|nr:peptidase domain-containing ABC transporter [Prevotella sp. P2-180]OYP62713.1 ABC transporter ATP-binding protein [Prevotella sp. P2-180]
MKIVYQHDSMQCGIACLQMVCHHYGRKVSVDFLANLCFATNQGISLLGISEAAEKIGLRSVGCRIPLATLLKAELPCILHWNQNHFVVLYKIKKRDKSVIFYIADPAKGLLTLSERDMEEQWVSGHSDGYDTGIALLLEKTPKFYDICTSHKESHSFRFLFGYISKYRRYFVQITLGLIISSLLQLVLPFLTQAIVDIGIKKQNIGFVWLILLGELMITISRTIVDFIRRWLLLHISMRVNISLIGDFFIKLLNLPMSFFDIKLIGDLMQRMNDHSRVNSFLTQQSLNILFTMITFVVFGGVLCWYNGIVFSIFFIGSLLNGGWILTFLRRRKILDYELFERQAQNNNKTYEFITSMQEIKLQDCEQRRRWEWEETQADLFEVQMKSLKLQQTQEAGNIFINEIKNIVITVVAASAVINGQMTLGMMLAVQYIIGQLNSPVEQLMQFFYSLQDVKISLERINEIHRAKNEDGYDKLKTSLKDVSLGINLNNISFQYNPHALRKTVENVNINIPHSKVTAIVGASGSGKTTLIKLLLGYYPVLEGSINVGGTDINELNKKWWRRQCGVVMQDGIIFSESIARNIAVGDGYIDTKRLVQAANMACIKDYIDKLPLGFNTKIGCDGIGLSQGQKQRILIARAIYKNPDYIFLDEATNSLDASNERTIIEHLDKFYQGKTVIIVAHRLSTVRNADQIIVLHDGKVVETGTHERLIASKGAYYNLVKNQLELGN